MPRKEVQQVNLVRPMSGQYYSAMESWEVLALGDKLQIETGRVMPQGKMHVTFYVRKDI